MNQFNELLLKCLRFFSAIIMAALVLVVCWQVLGRKLNLPTFFTDELAGYLLIWVSFLGTALVASSNSHIAIDLLMNRAKPASKKYYSFFIDIFSLLFGLLILTFGGILLVKLSFDLNQTSAALKIPIGYVYLIAPICGIIISYFTLYRMFQGKKDKALIQGTDQTLNQSQNQGIV